MIHVYLSGINVFVKFLSGAPTPSISHPDVHMLMKGLQKTEPQLAPKRLPLTSDLLACICIVCTSIILPSRQASPTFMSTPQTPSDSTSNEAKQTNSASLTPFSSYLSPFEPNKTYVNHRLHQHASLQDPLFIMESGRVTTRLWFHHHLCQLQSKSRISPESYSGHLPPPLVSTPRFLAALASEP